MLYFRIFILLFFINFSSAQQSKVDSLELLFKNEKDLEKKAEYLLKACKLSKKVDFSITETYHRKLLNYSESNHLDSYKYEAHKYLRLQHQSNS